MKKIFVRKVFEYDPTFNSKYSRYLGYRGITMQKLDPMIKAPDEIVLTNSFQPDIFCSSLLRGKLSAQEYTKIIPSSKIICCPGLNEVLFDLSDLLSEQEFKEKGSVLVRKRFIEKFIDDTLLEKRENIYQRITLILGELERLHGGNYLIISHSFFMKIFEVYLKNKSLFENPQLLKDNFDYRYKTFNFGGGFEFNL